VYIQKGIGVSGQVFNKDIPILNQSIAKNFLNHKTTLSAGDFIFWILVPISGIERILQQRLKLHHNPT
jgi:hypothetical protein